jgi:hypothetical protein
MPKNKATVATKEHHCQCEHKNWADHPVLNERKAEYPLIAEDLMQFFVSDTRERRVHHQDMPRRDRHGCRANAEEVQERHDSWSEPAQGHTEHHGGEDPSH